MRIEQRLGCVNIGNQDILACYRRFFTRPDLRKVLLSVPVLERATELRAHLDLKTPDALQAAYALSITRSAICHAASKSARAPSASLSRNRAHFLIPEDVEPSGEKTMTGWEKWR
ncbi:MAG: hypothetical protein L0Y67_03890 [Gammaproteobacteria bacterium]|nr:hypothetical protein [Gammaproteobacteria bacterium]